MGDAFFTVFAFVAFFVNFLFVEYWIWYPVVDSGCFSDFLIVLVCYGIILGCNPFPFEIFDCYCQLLGFFIIYIFGFAQLDGLIKFLNSLYSLL